MAIDQREDDAQSLCFDGPVLKKPISIIGRIPVRLRVAANKPQAQLAVRLNAIHPDGTVERISYGLLNLSHRDSHETPKPLKPGQFYDVTVELNEIAQTVPAGAALRLAISTSYWPIAWPSPELATVTVDPARSSIELPVLKSEKGLRKVAFKPAVKSAPAPVTVKDSGAETRHMILDIERQRMNFTIRRNDGTYVIDEIGTADQPYQAEGLRSQPRRQGAAPLAGRNDGALPARRLGCAHRSRGFDVIGQDALSHGKQCAHALSTASPS